jgi:hypothetical protein
MTPKASKNSLNYYYQKCLRVIKSLVSVFDKISSSQENDTIQQYRSKNQLRFQPGYSPEFTSTFVVHENPLKAWVL